MVGKVIKEVAEAVIKQGGETVPAKIKITEEVRAPFRELGLKPMPRDGGGLDLFDQTGSPVGTYDSVEDALSQLKKQQEQPGITAFHGSPYKFDEFKTEAIGTGEGAQAYGYGLYFAEEPDIARGYRKSTRYHSARREFQNELPDDASIDEVSEAINDGVFSEENANLLRRLEAEDYLGFDYPSQALDAVLRGDLKNYDASKELIEAVEGTDLNSLYENLTGAKATDLDYEKAAIVEQIMIDGDTLGVVQRQSKSNAYSDRAYKWFEKSLKPNFKAPGALYELNIKAQPEELLDFDKPFDQQPKKVQEALKETLEIPYEDSAMYRQLKSKGFSKDDLVRYKEAYERRVGSARESIADPNIKGSTLYDKISYVLGSNPKEASKALDRAGVKGIRYDDGLSRGKEGGTSNFVIFDPRIIEISKKYGVAIPVAATMLQNQDAQAATIEAVDATVDGEATPEQIKALRNYVELKSQNIPQTGGGTVFAIDQIDLDPPIRIQQPSFDRDDATGKILNARQEADIDPYLLQAQQEAAAMERTTMQKAGDVAETVGAVAGDIFGGVIEAPRQALAGFLDATAEMAEIMESIIPLGGETVTIDAEPRTATGGVVRGISQFLTGFAPALKALKLAGVSAKAAPWLAGAFADAAGFDAHEERLSDLIQEYPALQNPVTEYLQADPTDSEAEGRFKNALEGAALGGLTEGFVKAVKFIKARKSAKETAAKEGATVTEAIEADPELQQRLSTEVLPDQEFIPFREQMGRNSAQFEFGAGSTAADADAAANINLNNIETPDDVKTIIDQVAAADATPINAARREKITNVELPKLADDLGMTVDDLLARRQGEAFNAEQILAARKILIASGEHLIKLAKEAATGGDMQLAMFRRAMAQHRAIQAQVSGMTAEAGRALQSFNIVAESSKAQERAIKEALETSGGIEVNQKMAQMISELDDPAQLGKFVKDANKATTVDMLYEVWINGLLSSPTTHMVNNLSNAMVAVLTVGERKVASAIGESIPPGEATAQLKGMIDGSREGLRLAWHALKSGEPSDVLEKVEVDQRRAISGQNLDVAGFAGRFADFVGELVRVPGRLLTTSDAFFKAVGYRMELHAQAYRQAFSEGLRDEAAAKRAIEIINNPPENIKMAAVDAGRYQTFTNSLSETRIKGIGEIGQMGESARRKKRVGPYARVIIPFVRTPTNIMSFMFERTPLAPLSRSIREEIAAGGARRDLALGKIVTGSTIMAVAADLTLSGQVTGAGPVDPQMRNIKRTTGWQPYSIKVGDKYYAYNRLDPVGGLIGLAADMSEIMGQVDEATADQIATAAVLSIIQNMSSKVYLSGVTEFLDALDSSSTDPEANNYKLTRYLQRLAGSMVPAAVANLERVMSPEMSATYGYIDRIKSRIPGYSDDLPPRRNIFGEPVVLEGGIGPDIMSPIYQSTDKKDPVADEIVRQQTDVAMPRRAVNGVELTPQQYDRYILLYSGEGLEGAKGVKLKDKLKETFASSQYRQATDGPEGGKSLFIRSIFTAYRDAAKSQLIREEPSLQTQIETEQRERIEKLTGRR